MNKAQNRLSTEIIDSIMRSLGTGSPKTRIMYNSYVSYSQLNSYLSILLKRGFIKHERETGLYKITPDGAEFLESIDEVREMVGEPMKEDLAFPIVRGSNGQRR